MLHQWTEKIQSSPQAMERSVYEVIGKEYRSSRVSLIELRFNPMKRNVGGERDLDHIVHAALRGMDRAVLEYGVRAGLIFCLAREFPHELNEILVEKAIKYRRRGVVGHRPRRDRAPRARADARRGGAVPRPLRAGPRGGAQDHRAHRRDRHHRAGGRAGGGGGARAAADRPRDLRGPRRAGDGPPARARGGARDLPELEPGHAGGRVARRSWGRCSAGSGSAA